MILTIFAPVDRADSISSQLPMPIQQAAPACFAPRAKAAMPRFRWLRAAVTMGVEKAQPSRRVSAVGCAAPTMRPSTSR